MKAMIAEYSLLKHLLGTTGGTKSECERFEELSVILAPIIKKTHNKKELQMKAAIIASLLFSSAVLANPPVLVNPQTGQYLGNLGGNKYDINSTSNEYGRYGSKYSADSIHNQYGKYGSRYSNDSPNNPYATNAPAIVAPRMPSIWD